MKSITTLIQELEKKNLKHKPASKEEIKDKEEEINLVLPKDYKEFLLKIGGIKLENKMEFFSIIDIGDQAEYPFNEKGEPVMDNMICFIIFAISHAKETKGMYAFAFKYDPRATKKSAPFNGKKYVIIKANERIYLTDHAKPFAKDFTDFLNKVIK